MSANSRGAASWVAAIVILGIAVLIAACGSSTSTSNSSPGNVTTTPGSTTTPATTSPSSPATTSPSSPSASGTSASMSAATCKHARSLQASLTSLTHVKLNASSAGQITKDLKNIETQLAALRTTPGFRAHAQQLNTSLNQVKQAAQGLGTSPSPGQVGSIVTALSGLRAKAGSTMSELRALCP